MTRTQGFKAGPFKALATGRTTDGRAIGLMPCSTDGCTETLAVRIDARGWPFTYCKVKTGCGRKTESKNKLSCHDVIARINEWAAPENAQAAKQLCEAIDLYPEKKKTVGFGEKAVTVETPIESKKTTPESIPVKTDTPSPPPAPTENDPLADIF